MDEKEEIKVDVRIVDGFPGWLYRFIEDYYIGTRLDGEKAEVIKLILDHYKIFGTGIYQSGERHFYHRMALSVLVSENEKFLEELSEVLAGHIETINEKMNEDENEMKTRRQGIVRMQDDFKRRMLGINTWQPPKKNPNKKRTRGAYQQKKRYGINKK